MDSKLLIDTKQMIGDRYVVAGVCSRNGEYCTLRIIA